jgi:tetratricopeptide (TPR) repeat protein
VELASGKPDQFKAIAQRLGLLATFGDTLELDDQLHLAAIFNAVNDTENFHRQFTTALREADASSLRHLRPESLYALLSLAVKTGQLEQRPGLWPYVNSLLNTNWRLKFLLDYSATEKDAGQTRHAVALLRRALGTDSESVIALGHLAWLLATSPDDSLRDGKEALALASQAHEIDQGVHVNITDTLACAFAENGEYTQAAALEDQAIKIAEAAQATTIADNLRAHLILFHNRLPYHESTQPPSAEP